MMCGETREMATTSECYRCYRRRGREAEKAQNTRLIERHMTAQQKRDDKIAAGLLTVMKGLTMMGVSHEERRNIRGQLQPYLPRSVKEILGGPPLPELPKLKPDHDDDDDDDSDEDTEREQ